MNIIITAGGTSERIDQVRKITNMSKGTLGRTIYKYAIENNKIEKIFFLSSKDASPSFVNPKLDFRECNSAMDVSNTLELLLTTEKIDVVIHSMAISDYTVDYLFSMEELAKKIALELTTKATLTESDILTILNSGSYAIDNTSKVSSNFEDLTIKLKKTEKIITKIKKWSPNTKLLGFKLLNNVSKEELISVALEQQSKNDCNYVFANDIAEIRKSGHAGYFVYNKDNVVRLEGIENIAKYIVNTISE